MTTFRRAICGLAAVLAVLTALAGPAAAQALLDPNTAAQGELEPLPHMTPAVVQAMIAKRPFKTVLELNAFLLEQKVSAAQAREFYRRAFVKINLNTGKREEFLLIPRVGSRMAAELMEYRPWKTWAQFDKEIGKYVGQQEVDRLKQYVLLPPA